MPAWQTIENWGGFKIYAEPVGWRSKRIRGKPIFKWLACVWPYRYGTKPRFTIIFERLDTPEQYTEFVWFLQFPGGLKTGQHINVPQLEPKQPHKEPAGDRLLGWSGDTILGIRHPGDEGFHTLYSFRVVALEDVIVGLSIAGAAVLLGFILGKS